MTPRTVVLLAALLGALAPAARAQGNAPVTQRGSDVMINFIDADLRGVIQTLSPYLDRPVLFSGVNPVRVTLQTPGPVPRAQVAGLLRATLTANNYELAEDGGTYVVRPRAQQGPPGGFPQQPVQPQPVAGARAQGGVQLFVIRLRHAKAADVAAVVNALYGRASALGELGGGRPPTLGSDLTRNQLPPYNPNQPTQPGATAVVTGRDATLSGDITIVPDSRTNSLLVRATPADFELIQAAVQEIDIRPLQVLVEVVIAEVQRNSGFALGLFAGADSIHAKGDVLGFAALNDSLDLPGNGLILRALRIGHYQFNVTLAAAAS
ncbi:MAG TPA: secretin N-terminal domain-containing protein, partial [Longimicrobium sp.]|nr:secretin N-terminal domain-containing protein [Longimicrobium sp.]